ncbi:MAG: glycosyltransferase family 39 protein [Cypionkella sp.]
MPSLDPMPPNRSLTFIGLHMLVWYVMIVIAKPFLDNYGDMAEVYAWSQHLLMGSDKHPQFLPWMAHLWFEVAPRSVASFYALAAINLGVAFVGIYALGRQLLATRGQALAAVALQALAFPYLTLADKLNMNAICQSTWPWAVWAFVVALNHPTARGRNLAALGFGILAAVAMLSKYYSAVLMASVLIIAFTPRVIGIWRKPTPWLALGAFSVAILPHLLWQRQHGFETMGYIEEQGKGLDLHHFISFGLTPIYYWIIPWGTALAMLYRGPVWVRFAHSLRMTGASDVLWYLAVLPYAVSMVLGAAGFVQLSEPWAIPIGYAFTLLWMRNADVGAERLAARCAQILRAFRWVWLGMLALGVTFAIWAAQTGEEQLYYPESEAASAIDTQWQSLAPGQTLAWASSRNDAARVAFFSHLTPVVEALPALPDALPDYYPPRPNWRAEGGVVICPLGKGSDATAQTDCTRQAANWAAKEGFALIPYRFSVQRAGLYFPRQRPYAFAAFFHLPMRAN